MYVCQLQGNSPEIAGVMLQSERTQCRKWRGKVHSLHCWAAGSPAATPNPPRWHLARLECRVLRLSAPTQGLPASQRTSRGITVLPTSALHPPGVVCKETCHDPTRDTLQLCCRSRRSPSGVGPSPCLPGSPLLEPVRFPFNTATPRP